jgi:hypothetical protein
MVIIAAEIMNASGSHSFLNMAIAPHITHMRHGKNTHGLVNT